jgi:hypothetical protein
MSLGATSAQDLQRRWMVSVPPALARFPEASDPQAAWSELCLACTLRPPGVPPDPCPALLLPFAPTTFVQPRTMGWGPALPPPT